MRYVRFLPKTITIYYKKKNDLTIRIITSQINQKNFDEITLVKPIIKY